LNFIAAHWGIAGRGPGERVSEIFDRSAPPNLFTDMASRRTGMVMLTFDLFFLRIDTGAIRLQKSDIVEGTNGFDNAAKFDSAYSCTGQ
jgi:hypothetical protein